MSRRAAKVWTAVCVVLSVAGLALNIVGAGRASAGATEDSLGGAGSVVVASVVGVVEVREEGGEWTRVSPGHAMSRGAEVRTQDFSQVILRPNQGAVLTLTPNTSFTIGDETPEVSRFTLGVGRVAADVTRRRDRTYEFDAGDGQVRADTQGGEFHLVADGEGLLGVVTHRGEVGLSSEGSRVVVGAGQQAVALPGAPPGAPLNIPEEVFLQVQWPEGRTSRETTVTVSGRTDVGARVSLGGRFVPVRHDGRFELDLPLTEGENRLVAYAEDASGNVMRSQSPVFVREVYRPPPLQLKVEGSVWE